jgi:hypothetical protein
MIPPFFPNPFLHIAQRPIKGKTYLASVVFQNVVFPQQRAHLMLKKRYLYCKWQIKESLGTVERITFTQEVLLLWD